MFPANLLENEVNSAEKWAKLTARNSRTYPRESSDCLLAGFVEEPECRILRVTPSTIRQFLGKQHTLLLVWTRSIDVIQKSAKCKLGYPLLRIQRDTKNPSILTLSDPENSFDVEFVNAESASKFIELINQAFTHWRTRTNGANSSIDYVPHPPAFESSRIRHGRFRFSALHRFANCDYEGSWLDLRPHGRGHLKYPDGRQYRGRFVRGEIDGLGEMVMKADNEAEEMSVSGSLVNSIFYSHPKDVADSCSWLKGRFKSGKLNGLGSAMFLNGDLYEGFWSNGLMNGHGVYRVKDDLSVYVGAWKDGVRHGYGLWSSNQERYLGQWNENKQNGQGSIITIDGVYSEGVFQGSKFVNGRVVFETGSALDPNSIVTFEGKFDGLGVASGKGTLHLNRRDSISGTMHGRILRDELAISNAIYKHDSSQNANEDEDFFMTGGPIRSPWMFDEKQKWIELFVHFLEDQLKVSKDEFFEVMTSQTVVSLDLAARTWNHLAASVSKIKQQKGVFFDDRIERVPADYFAEFSSDYYDTVSEYWSQCSSNEHHPLSRLNRGVVEVFCSSYCSVGTHVVSMYDSAVLELREMLRRCYAISRILFVNLPPVDEMFNPVPSRLDNQPDDESSSSSPDSVSIGSLEELSNRVSTSDLSLVRRKLRSELTSTSSGHSATTTLNIPVCDFLINTLFSALYADLFTVYCERCQTADRRYWERVLQLNSHTDSQLLRYFDVKGDLWPADFENTRELDTFTVRVSARNKFYNKAVSQFQQISGAFNPTDKLGILAETFFEITSCTAKFANVGPKYAMGLDDLLGPFLFVIVRAQVQHLGAEIRYTHDFCRHQVDSSSEIAFMFTILQSAYMQICKERSHP